MSQDDSPGIAKELTSPRENVTVPSFICDEHILSQEVHEGKINREITVDAVFSVTRSTAKANTLEESREVKLVDGKPAPSKNITMPLSFSGEFSGALNKFLSSDHRLCFEYAADPSTPSPEGIAVFTFVAKPATAGDPDCASVQPGTTGRFHGRYLLNASDPYRAHSTKSCGQGSDRTRYRSGRLRPRYPRRQVFLAPHHDHCIHHRDFENEWRPLYCSLQQIS
jgi:hypothetical protein